MICYDVHHPETRVATNLARSPWHRGMIYAACIYTVIEYIAVQSMTWLSQTVGRDNDSDARAYL